MKHPDNIYKKCISLCEAINKINGLQTTSCCCGHDKCVSRIFFRVKNLEELPILLYYIDPYHVGFRWWCKVSTDCAMSPVSFYIESEALGEQAKIQALIIAKEIFTHLKTDESDIPTECLDETLYDRAREFKLAETDDIVPERDCKFLSCRVEDCKSPNV